MRRFVRSFVLCAVLFAGFSVGLAQAQSADEAKAEKEFYESVEREIDRLTRLLDLNDAQVFFVDSIIVHDYKAMQAEMKDLNDRKVSNVNMYYDVQDKWHEQIYEAYQKIFDEDQWAKYLKSGAARDKKSRDKRRAKAQR